MNFNIVVLIKQVPDTRNVGKDAMKEDGTVNRAVLPAIINPEDLNALELALSIKDNHPTTKITVLTMGLPKATEVLREALFRGADEAILLTDRRLGGADTLATSYSLAQAIRKIGSFDLIVAGRQAIDGDTAQVGPQVAEKLGLPGNPCESVRLLTEKDLFRDFLQTHGFNSPVARGYTSYEDALAEIGRFKFPVMVKPVDSSGSKGVVKINCKEELKPAVAEALSYSRGKRFVVEEFIVKKGYQVSGDGFSVDGKLVFTSYGNELYSSKGTREYVALGEFWPSLLTHAQKDKVDAELQRLITALGMRTCAYNIEVILDKNDDVYILELGPRNGGSYIPQLIKYATGVDLVDATLKAAMGDVVPHLEMTSTKGVFSNYMIYSTVSGRFKELDFEAGFRSANLLETHCTALPGDVVYAYQNTSHSLGTILFRAQSVDEMISITDNIQDYYRVVVK